MKGEPCGEAICSHGLPTALNYLSWNDRAAGHDRVGPRSFIAAVEHSRLNEDLVAVGQAADEHCF